VNSMVLALGLLMTHPNYLDSNESSSIGSAITAGEHCLVGPPSGRQIAYSIGFVDGKIFPSRPAGVRVLAVRLYSTSRYQADQRLLGPVVEKKTHIPLLDGRYLRVETCEQPDAYPPTSIQRGRSFSHQIAQIRLSLLMRLPRRFRSSVYPMQRPKFLPASFP